MFIANWHSQDKGSSVITFVEQLEMFGVSGFNSEVCDIVCQQIINSNENRLKILFFIWYLLCIKI